MEMLRLDVYDAFELEEFEGLDYAECNPCQVIEESLHTVLPALKKLKWVDWETSDTFFEVCLFAWPDMYGG